MTHAPLWSPGKEQIANARLTQFIERLRERGVLPAAIVDAHALQRWSVENPEAFWSEIWRAAGIRADGPGEMDAPWSTVLHGGEHMGPPDPQLGPHWFVDTRLNFAEHLLRHREGIAIVSWNEQGRTTSLTFEDLADRVARAAAAMRAAGIDVGDRVVGWLPNIAETVIVMLAATSIGAVWSSCSPDFGTQGVLDRFGQIEPRLLIASTAYQYAGKRIDCMERLATIVDALPTLEAVWVVPHTGERDDVSLASIKNAEYFPHVIARHDGATCEFTRLPFAHPLYILYSSGTTGLPKCIVHGAGGTLLQHWKELALHTDLSAGDRLFYFTTCGWMMWNWLVSALALGVTIVLYDGAPLAPDAAILWKMAEQERITTFGTSAKYLAMLEKAGVKPSTRFDLSALSAILSTGSPLAEHSYDFVYRDIKSDVRLSSISGGTDIVSCFALGDPTGAVYRGELQMRGLGMSVEVFDDNGTPLIGEAGELVCTRPFPSMPIAFWNDPDRSKYRSAYFEQFPGVWRHGDWAAITEHDGLVIYGRSDATLNPGGVRIGTAEIYRQVEQFPQVMESLVVEQTIGGVSGTYARIVLFVRMQDGVAFDHELRDQIRQRIRENTSPHHVPRVIVPVADIPRTVSGKISELAVKEIIHGRPVRNVNALANPQALEEYRQFAEARGIIQE